MVPGAQRSERREGFVVLEVERSSCACRGIRRDNTGYNDDKNENSGGKGEAEKEFRYHQSTRSTKHNITIRGSDIRQAVYYPGYTQKAHTNMAHF